MNRFNEAVVEQAALDWLAELGYRTGFGPVDAAVGDVRESPQMLCCGVGLKMLYSV